MKYRWDVFASSSEYLCYAKNTGSVVLYKSQLHCHTSVNAQADAAHLTGVRAFKQTFM